MRRLVIVILACGLLGAVRAETCARWNLHSICSSSGAKEHLFEKIQNTVDRLFFKNAYVIALEDQKTTLTMSEFNRYYLPYLQRSFLTFDDGDTSTTKGYSARVKQAITSLPKDSVRLYSLYGNMYSYEFFLYQWTIAEIKARGLQPPSDLLIDKRQSALPDYEEMVHNGVSNPRKAGLKSELISQLRMQQDLQNIRKYLLINKIVDQVELDAPFTRNQLITWNRDRLLAIITPGHREFAEKLVLK